MAALDIIVREAGGYFTSLDGEPGPMGGSALATNGKLHDQALAFLGSLEEEHAPHPGGTVHDLSARRGDPVGDRDS
jgi:histidinol-phosphatase